MPTANIVLDGCWDKVTNTAKGGYHYIAANPYLTISLLAIAGLVVLFLVIIGIVFIAKASEANRVQMPEVEPTPVYKYEDRTVIKTTTTKKPTKPVSKKKSVKKTVKKTTKKTKVSK